MLMESCKNGVKRVVNLVCDCCKVLSKWFLYSQRVTLVCSPVWVRRKFSRPKLFVLWILGSLGLGVFCKIVTRKILFFPLSKLNWAPIFGSVQLVMVEILRISLPKNTRYICFRVCLSVGTGTWDSTSSWSHG